MLFDLHCHAAFKPANSKGANGQIPDMDMWNERKKQGISDTDLIKESFIYTSQSHFNALTEGNVRVVCNCLYSLERQFTVPEGWVGWANNLTAKLTGFDITRINEIRDRKNSYFKELEREYEILKKNRVHTQFSAKGNSYVMVNSVDELKNELRKSKDTLCFINTVEGIHCFAEDLYTPSGEYIPIKPEQRKKSALYKEFLKKTCRNIQQSKEWEHPPFFITLAHHFYNFFFGHSLSFPAIQNGFAPLPNGKEISYFYLGIYPYGREVLSTMLGKYNSENKPVRRILPDCKHLNPQGRMEYYDYIRPLKNTSDEIPVIHSHTAISGRKKLKRSIENSYKLFDDEKSEFYNQDHINLYDEDIVETVNSDGIIGIMLDDKRIIGEKLPPECNLTKKQFKEKREELTLVYNECSKQRSIIQNPNSSQEEKNNAHIILTAFTQKAENKRNEITLIYGAVILRQFFRVAELCGEKGWNHVCIGTDYDGVINPADIYSQADKLKYLSADLEKAWIYYKNSIGGVYSHCLFGKTPTYFIEKITLTNGLNFLEKYFHDEFLINGKKGTPNENDILNLIA